MLDLRLDGKVAIVTGAARGIGAATAKLFAEHGAKVVSLDITTGCDITDERAVVGAYAAAAREHGGIDILVNNAGLALGRDPVWDSREEDERGVIEANVLGLMRMTRLVLPHIRDGGHIVNLGSVAGIWSYPSGSSYVASKFAVHGYTRALRDDLHGRPIRVTNVAPGLVGDTEFSNVRFRGDDEKAAGVYRDVALGGALGPEDVADCIMFAVTRPPHVNIDEIVLMALAQVSGGNILRQ
jgi:3-hydroxy acid dehydrogenase / malonic semialdehyde reductase